MSPYNNDCWCRCTKCQAPLMHGDGGALRCTSCAATYPSPDGIPSFSRNSDYFFGEISREQMRRLAGRIKSHGWRDAFNELLSQIDGRLAEYIEQYIGDETRAAWKFLLNLPPGGVALDFGCGWGTTSIALARSMRHVISMDLTLERLLLLRERAAAAGCDNVSVVHGGDVLPLPFPDDSIDIAVMNGVLEWCPMSLEGTPRGVQLGVLRELRRLLKPSGQLYIGIENRFGYPYFLGRPDEHSRMMYTTLMPRWLANVWSRHRRKQPYRTYTYSMSAYRRLLNEAGFASVNFYWPYPDYREFHTLIDLSSRSAVRDALRPKRLGKRLIVTSLSSVGVLPRIVPSFGIVSGGAEDTESFIRSAINCAGDSVDGRIEPPHLVKITKSGVVLAFCRTLRGRPGGIVMRLPLDESASLYTQKAAAALTEIRSCVESTGAENNCAGTIPRMVAKGKVERQTFTIEEWMPGKPGSHFGFHEDGNWTLFVAASDWLSAFQRGLGSGENWAAGTFATYVSTLLRQVRENEWRLDGSFDLESVASASVSVVANAAVPVVRNHGDFHIGNVLFERKPLRVSGLVDWDLYESRGFPLVDIFYLLVSRRLEFKRESFAAATRRFLDGGTLEAAEQELISAYEHSIGISGHLRPVALLLMIMWVLDHNSKRRQAGMDVLCAGLGSVIGQVIDAIEELAGALKAGQIV